MQHKKSSIVKKKKVITNILEKMEELMERRFIHDETMDFEEDMSGLMVDDIVSNDIFLNRLLYMDQIDSEMDYYDNSNVFMEEVDLIQDDYMFSNNHINNNESIDHEVFEYNRMAVSKKLENRPNPNFLIETNILKCTPDMVSSRIHQSSVSTRFRLLKDEVGQKLRNRPSWQSLLSMNIVKFDHQISPRIHKSQSSLLFKQNQRRLKKKLYNRPSIDELKTCNIIKEKKGIESEGRLKLTESN